MTQLIRHDLFDIFKVNTLSFGTIGLTQADLVAMNEIIQSTGNSILILLAIGYTAFKIVKIFREMKWDKQDRMNNE
jgi:hypothetical protein